MEYMYDVAISFAEEDRDAAVALAGALESQGMNVYYYPDNRADDVGYNIEHRLITIYSEQAQFAITLLSENYFKEEKVYTKIELAAIQRRMESDPGIVYLLPVKLTDFEIPSEYLFLAELIYLEWNHEPDQIAEVLKKLLGKKLSASPDESVPGNVVYNNTGQTIVDSDIKELNQQIINNTRFSEQTNIDSSNNNTASFDGTVADGDITGRDKAGRDIAGRDINNINLGFKSPREFSCPYCGFEQDGKKYGKQVCQNCQKTFYVRNAEREKDILEYKTLTPDDARNYNKVLAHINNCIRDRDYESAYKFCQKAEEIAPAEVTTWKNFALVEFLLEITKRNNRKETIAIMKSVKSNIEKCKDHGISEQEYDEFVVDIANRLFNIERSRINSVKAQYVDATRGDAWSRSNLLYLQQLLRSYDICYNLYNDTLFLKEYVKELTKEHKWVMKTAAGEFINTPACGNFNAYEKIQLLAKAIKGKEDDYKIPEIAEERFAIRKVEYFKINSITQKT